MWTVAAHCFTHTLTTSTLCCCQAKPCLLSCWTGRVYPTRRPPVCLNLISITDQLTHSISKHTLSHVHIQPSEIHGLPSQLQQTKLTP